MTRVIASIVKRLAVAAAALLVLCRTGDAAEAAMMAGGLIGVLFDQQAVQVNVSNTISNNQPADPCEVQIDFIVFDPATSAGSVFKTTSFTLKNGQTNVADFGRTELVPLKGKTTVFPRVLITQSGLRTPTCRAAVELIELVGFDRTPGRTIAAIGDPQIRPRPDTFFPAITLVTGQALRINAVNMGDPELAPCPVVLNVFDAAGITLAEHTAIVPGGSATSLDVFIGDPQIRPQLRAAGQRRKDLIAKEACATFAFSVEVYDLTTATLIMGGPNE